MHGRTTLRLFAIAGMLVTTTASGQTADVAVDATAPGAPVRRVWAYHGYDEVNYSTVPEGIDLLRTLATIHATPPYVRSHFLLNSGNGAPAMKWGSTGVFTEDGAGNPVYDWTLMDGILDAVTGAGALPFAEIGFMPHDLSVHPDPYVNSSTFALDGGCFYPPKDYAAWGNLIEAWARHSAGRYPSVGASWQWELWNEPDGAYWKGSAAEYLKLYDYTEAAIHRAVPGARLGGPAVASAGSPLLAGLLDHCATGTNAVTGAAGTRLDMVTFHAKGGVVVTNGKVEMNLGNQLRLDRVGFDTVAHHAQFKALPIVISEADPDGCAACSAASVPADTYRSSPAYGAYEAAMMKRTLELADRDGVNLRGLVTWAFMFEGQPYFPGLRILSTRGVHMPVLAVFELLGALSGDDLPVTSDGARTLDDILANSVRQQPDIDAMATLSGQRVQVIVWNYHDDLETAPPAAVHLRVAVPHGFGARAIVSHRRVDDSHGDAYTTWLSQGSPKSPSPAQMAALQQAMRPAELASTQPIAFDGKTLQLDFDLPRFGVSLLTITPDDEADASTSFVDGGGDVAALVDADGELRVEGDVEAEGSDAGVAESSGERIARGDSGTPAVVSRGPTGCSCRMSGARREGDWALLLGGAAVVWARMARERSRAGR